MKIGRIIGPFAHLRPLSEVKAKAKIGNFVEVKKSVIGKGTKANHLTYIGDSLVGEGVNIGAGTITCNYDGFEKHQTIIGDRVFVGSNVELVAPVKVGNDASIGAGTTVTKDVPDGALAISRVKQKNHQGVEQRRWSSVVKKKIERTGGRINMCGIIGYIGPRETAKVLIEGLKRLEYRGYDSAGIAVFQKGKIEIRRKAGKLAEAGGSHSRRRPLTERWGSVIPDGPPTEGLRTKTPILIRQAKWLLSTTGSLKIIFPSRNFLKRKAMSSALKRIRRSSPI